MNSSEKDLADLITHILKKSIAELKSSITDLKKDIASVTNKVIDVENTVCTYIAKDAVTKTKIDNRISNVEEKQKLEQERLSKTRKKLFEIEADIRESKRFSIIRLLLLTSLMVFLYLSNSPIAHFSALSKLI